jgi:hypothetical protein
MKTFGKFPLFILWVLVCGCPNQKPAADPPPERTEAEETNPRAELEAACFDGDPAACDELGH